MKPIRILLVGALTALSLNVAMAADNPGLYDQLGGKPGITKIIDGMMTHILEDQRIKAVFANANIPHLKMMLVKQVCADTGGPCTYTGESMRAAHKGMNINSAQFNALVEDLQKSFVDNDVPIGAGNKLLAILAPMKKDVDHR
ncbi:MAG: group I truncated hemoglobin [Sulfuriferula sp.]